MRLPLLAATLATLAFAAPVAADTRTITVTGTGEMQVEPDMATIMIGVQTEADIAADALDQASAATASILARLDVEGVALSDIRTSAIRLNPRYSQSVLSNGREIAGYQAVNSVQVQVNDLDSLGGLLAAVVGDGANRLDSVTFGLQDPSAATDEARRLAVAEAVRRADLYAQAAGVSLGDVLTISEQGAGGYQPYRAEPVVMESLASAPSFDVPVASGEIRLNASVTIVFEIAD